MRPLLLAAALLAAAPPGAVLAAPAPADWRQAGLSDGVKQALRQEGLRLEDDGRVVDARTRAPLTDPQLAEVLKRLDLGTQRLALERLELLLAKDPMSPAERAEAEALKDSLPPDVARALDARASVAELRRLTGARLGEVAAWFDGARTLDERRAAAAPVAAGAPGAVSYYNADERAVGEALRAAAVARLSGDPVGRRVLSRLAGPDGKPDLPPVLLEDLPGQAAQYDFKRRALVLDREAAVAALSSRLPPAARSAFAAALRRPGALTAYLAGRPDMVPAVIDAQDALVVHELTHAWQDRRDPVMQEMARGNLPLAVLIDDEVEAWTVKNLYVASRLKRAPGSAIDPQELDDYRRMVAAPDAWERDLRRRYRDSAVNAMDVSAVRAIARRRLDAARARTVTGADAQTAKALDLAAMTRAQRELAASAAAQERRLRDAAAERARATAAAAGPLAGHYLALSLDAPNDIERAVDLQTADDYAVASGDAALLAKVRALKGRRR